MAEALKPTVDHGLLVDHRKKITTVSPDEFNVRFSEKLEGNVGSQILILSTVPEVGFSGIGGLIARTEDIKTYGAHIDRRGRWTGRVIERPDLAPDPKKEPITIARPWNFTYVAEEDEWVGPNPALFSFNLVGKVNLSGENFMIGIGLTEGDHTVLMGESVQKWIDANVPDNIRARIADIEALS